MGENARCVVQKNEAMNTASLSYMSAHDIDVFKLRRLIFSDCCGTSIYFHVEAER